MRRRILDFCSFLSPTGADGGQGALGRFAFQLFCLICLAAFCAWAQSPEPADQICPRLAPGSIATSPADLASQKGVLEVTFKFLSVVDEQGLTRYCYVSETGLQAPTLHASPGDHLIIHLQNQLVGAKQGMDGMQMEHSAKRKDSTNCTGDGEMTSASTNLHFHGLNIPPACHQDEVVHTLVQPSESFDYEFQIPPDEPPGLYWYHPHPHGFSAGQVRGGGSGALIVDGIEAVVPAVSGLFERTLVLRDQDRVAGGAGAPSGDISLNYVPITFPGYVPATLQTGAGEKELWRVVNAASFTIFNLQYVINGVAQPVQLIAIDGVPVGGTQNPQSLTEQNIELPPGARAEFVVTTPGLGDQAQLVTEQWDSGPAGFNNPARPIANVVAQAKALASEHFVRRPPKISIQKSARFKGLRDASPSAERTLYFSENFQTTPASFYITVEGQAPAIFNMNQPPNIVVNRGAIEAWTIENRTNEDHIFHIHQLHFQVLEIDGQPVNDPAIRDTVRVPYWSGSGPYPSVKLSMDFRDPNISGTFVYHCHILDHEDLGMMGEIQVVPTPIATTTTLTTASATVNMNASVAVTAQVASAPYSGAPISGTVQFTVDGVNSGSPVPVANGVATFKTSFITGGAHKVAGIYSGDTNYQTSTSNALDLTVAGFALVAGSPTVSGTSATATITVTTFGGFNSTVSLACSVPSALADGTCSIRPTSFAGPGRATLTVHQNASSASQGQSGLGRGAAALLACLVLVIVPARKWNLPARLTLVLIACLLTGVGCSDSNGGPYNIMVSGNGQSNGSTIQNTLTVPIPFR